MCCFCPLSIPVPIRVLFAQFRLEEFAYGSPWNFRSENKRIGQLPLREFCGQKFTQLFRLHRDAFFRDNHSQRALLPFRMRHAYHSSFTHAGMAHQRVFKINGANPFAAGFDEVLAAVKNFNVTLVINRRYIAGAKPSVGGPAIGGFRRFKIGCGDPGPANFQLPGRGAVPRRFALRAHHSQFDERRRNPLLRADFIFFVIGAMRQCGLDQPSGGQRGRFGHAPKMGDMKTEAVEAAQK